MKLTARALIVAIALLFTVACVQVPHTPSSSNKPLAISSVRDLPTTYAKGSVFALSPKYLKETSLKPQQTQAAYQFYGKAIVADLQSHGFSQTSNASQADFLVGFGVALTSDLTDNVITEKFGVTPGLKDKAYLEKGSFLIYILDTKTRNKVWRGTVQGFVKNELTHQQRNKRVANMVYMVLKQFYTEN